MVVEADLVLSSDLMRRQRRQDYKSSAQSIRVFRSKLKASLNEGMHIDNNNVTCMKSPTFAELATLGQPGRLQMVDLYEK